MSVHLMLPVNVALTIPINTLVSDVHTMQPTATTPEANIQGPHFNVKVITKVQKKNDIIHIEAEGNETEDNPK